MPDSTIDLLIRFLAQGKGTLSKRARTREFSELTEIEIGKVERFYEECFGKTPKAPEDSH